MTPEELASSNTETAHQMAVVAWANMAANYGYLAADDKQSYKVTDYARTKYGTAKAKPCLHYLFAIPNGGLRTRVTAARLKAGGVKSGVPDLCLPFPNGDYHALFIEMKQMNTGKLRGSQKKWLDYLTKLDYKIAVAYNWSAARETLIQYIGD